MSSIPVAGPGICVVRNNMKEARNRGEPGGIKMRLTAMILKINIG